MNRTEDKWFSPLHVLRSEASRKPELHPQLNPPTVLEQVWSQLSVLEVHSFISAQYTDNSENDKVH